MIREVRRVWDVTEWVEDQLVEWWEKSDFNDREVKLWSGGVLKQTIKVGDDVIICDLCNTDIEDFPCPVWHGMALCKECRERVKLTVPLEKV